MEKTPLCFRNNTDGILKVVLFGPESTGKTTLAKALAKDYETVWVPEYMRVYLEEKWKKENALIEKDDLVPIAKGQLSAEAEQLKRAHLILFCDTNLLEIKVYSEYYYHGFCPDFILENMQAATYDLYLLTDIDVPWEDDLLRDRPRNREEMFSLFKHELITKGLPYVTLSGSLAERMELAKVAIQQLGSIR